jgi:glycosyltransferase involved in cell wall biosynthesis
MKIMIVNNCVPFVYGGAEFLADSLRDKLIEYGHQAILIKIPFTWDPPQKILENILLNRLIRVNQNVADIDADRVIALKFPVYYIEHPNKVLWLLHQFRQVYDLWGTQYGLPQTPENIRIKEAIIQADNLYLRKAKRICTNSSVVSGRLKRFNDIDSEVLYPPLMDAERYHTKDYGDYIFYPSRIVSGKRQQDAIESMKHVKSGVKLVIAGHSERRDWLDHLESLVRDNGLSDRVKIIGRWISQEEKIELFANALGAVYIPVDEDSYGYVSLEAYHSKKPVITCTDSGGTLEVVEDGKTGYVVPPEPRALAEAMDKLYYDKASAQKMGDNGLEKVRSMHISWDHVIQRLTQ